MSPVGLSPASQTASSSSTLWAQPSREWVIPAKPKPGRKPKKETSINLTVTKDDPDEESSDRRVQNRAAQRAFRERKQTQLTELQARLHAYEQGEIERNIALQNIAKKMKEENEELRKENHMLREKIARLEHEHDGLANKDKMILGDDTARSSPDFPPTDNGIRKRARVEEDNEEALRSVFPFHCFPSSSSSMVSSPDDASPAGAFSPAGPESHSRHSFFPTPPPVNSFAQSNESITPVEGQDSLDPYACVLCSPDEPCVCREVVVQQAPKSSDAFQQQPLQTSNLPHSTVSLDQPMHINPPPPNPSMSILDNLPAFQAPVPIRRRTGPSRANTVFPVTPLAPTSSPSTPRCSGDPENCMACADDSFGKAFCQAIDHTVNSTVPCIDCPRRTNQTDKILVGGCCGDISKCGSCGIAPIISSTNSQRGPETVPTDDAWRQLKSHPNVAFADLTLLAEVVARRSTCTGSRVVISPASITPDQEAGPSHHWAATAGEDQSVLLTDPHEHFRQKQRQRESPPRLVPQHVLIECGRRRMREVNADGVRAALRLLDQKFAHTR